MFEHAAEFRRCLTELDVTGIRRLWRCVGSHLDQPRDDAEALKMMHMARVRMLTLPDHMRAYSEAWLIERNVERDTFAVGVSVKSASSNEPYRRRRGIYVQHEMTYSVEQSIRQGIGLKDPKDAAEVKRRLMLARERA